MIGANARACSDGTRTRSAVAVISCQRLAAFAPPRHFSRGGQRRIDRCRRMCIAVARISPSATNAASPTNMSCGTPKLQEHHRPLLAAGEPGSMISIGRRLHRPHVIDHRIASLASFKSNCNDCGMSPAEIEYLGLRPGRLVVHLQIIADDRSGRSMRFDGRAP